MAYSQHEERVSSGASSQDSGFDKILYGDIFPQVPSWNPHDNLFQHSARVMSLDEAITGLPSITQCDVLVWAYIMGYQTLTPLFHAQSFLHEFRGYKNWLVTSLIKYKFCLLTLQGRKALIRTFMLAHIS